MISSFLFLLISLCFVFRNQRICNLFDDIIIQELIFVKFSFFGFDSGDDAVEVNFGARRYII